MIDALVFGGSSGSPVFVGWDGRYRLLGVIESTLVGTISKGSKEHPAALGLSTVIEQRHVKELGDLVMGRIEDELTNHQTV